MQARLLGVSQGSNRVNDELSLRELREERELSLRDVEASTSLSRGVLSEIERGHRLPSLINLVELSELYGVDPSDWEPKLEYRIHRTNTIQGG